MLDTKTRPELVLTDNAKRVLRKRYLLRDENNKVVETPEELFWRVASCVAKGEEAFLSRAGKGDRVDTLVVKRTAEKFYDLMANLYFLPNSPTLGNAGKPNGQLSACFVLPVGDSMGEIFDSIKNAAMIHKTGGGTGFAFSRLRPAGSIVGSTGGIASGPVSFMRVFDAATEAVKQGGSRRGANMGVLRVDHPDIIEFIKCKEGGKEFSNFNISVAITSDFMKAVEANEPYLLRSSSGETCGSSLAKDVLQLIVNQSWAHGDPGIIFLDRINRDNPTPQFCDMESTNPCGEQPLLPYEACNLGSIDLGKMVDEELYCTEPTLKIDWDLLGETVNTAVHFLDNVVEVNSYPLPEIDVMARGNRRIGLGVMGLADLLIKLHIPYYSFKAQTTAEAIMKFIQDRAHAASYKLAEIRGTFPNYKESSDFVKRWGEQRNATVTTIAPTGTISIIAGCSSGIEPLYGLSYWRHVLDGEKLLEVHPAFEATLKRIGIYSDELMEQVAETGSCFGIDGIPAIVKTIFAVAHDIAPHDHVKMQAIFQRHTDNAVSKTVNFASGATSEDVMRVYLQAYKLGCKGITIYRDGSRDVQVLNHGNGHKIDGDRIMSETANAVFNNRRSRGRKLSGTTEKIETADGDLYITINREEWGVAEVFLQIGKSGSLTNSLTEAIGRILSIALQSGIDPLVLARQLTGIQCGDQIWYDGELVKSVPDAVGLAVKKAVESVSGKPYIEIEKPENMTGAEFASIGQLPVALPTRVCPECSNSLFFKEGCWACESCGFSKC